MYKFWNIRAPIIDNTHYLYYRTPKIDEQDGINFQIMSLYDSQNYNR